MFAAVSCCFKRDQAQLPLLAADRVVLDWSLALRFQRFLAEPERQKLFLALLLNWVRDVVWAAWSVRNYGISAHETLTWTEQLGGQLLWCFVAIVLACFALEFSAWCFKFKLERLVMSAAALAALVSMIPWGAAQYYGMAYWREAYGMTETQASFMAGIFTGLAEGPAQYGVSLLVLACFGAQVPACRVGREFFLSASVGAVPGDVWEWVFALGQWKQWDVALTSFMVSTAVLLCNFLVALIVPRAEAGLESLCRPFLGVSAQEPRRGAPLLLMESP